MQVATSDEKHWLFIKVLIVYAFLSQRFNKSEIKALLQGCQTSPERAAGFHSNQAEATSEKVKTKANWLQASLLLLDWNQNLHQPFLDKLDTCNLFIKTWMPRHILSVHYLVPTVPQRYTLYCTVTGYMCNHYSIQALLKCLRHDY